MLKFALFIAFAIYCRSLQAQQQAPEWYAGWALQPRAEELWQYAARLPAQDPWRVWAEMLYRTAEHRPDEALALYNRNPKPSQGIIALEWRLAHLYARQTLKAEYAHWEEWTELIDALEAQGLRQRAAMARYYQIHFYYLLDNRYQETHRRLQALLDWLRQNADPATEVYHQVVLGIAVEYYNAGSYKQSAAVLDAHYPLAQRHLPGDYRLLNQYAEWLGYAYNEQGDVDRGETYYNLAYQYALKTGNPYRIAQAVYGLARIGFFRARPWSEIRPLMERAALTLDTLAWDPRAQARNEVFTHLILAEYYINDNQVSGQLDKMLDFYKKHQSDILTYNLNPEDCFRLRSDIHFYRNEVPELINQLEQKLAFCRQRYGESHLSTVTAYMEITRMEIWCNDAEKGLFYAEQGIQAATRGKSVGELAAEGVYDCAFLEDFYTFKAGALGRLKRYEEAYEQWRLALAYMEQQRRHAHQLSGTKVNALVQRRASESVVAVGRKLFQTKGDSTYLLRMLEDVEQSRSASLFEYISKFRNQDEQPLGVPDSLLRLQERMMHDIDSLHDQIRLTKSGEQSERATQLRLSVAERQAEFAALQDAMQREYPDARFGEKAERLQAEKLQAALDDQTAYLSYFCIQGAVFVFCATNDALRLRTIPIPPDSLQKRIFELRASMMEFDPERNSAAEYERLALAFYRDFVADSLLESKPRWIVVPDHWFGLLPLEALVYAPAGGGKTIAYDQLNYLMGKYDIRYEYGAALMLSRRAPRPAPRRGVLALAPSYGDSLPPYKELPEGQRLQRSSKEWALRRALTDLPGARRELQAIQGLFSGEFWTGTQANEADFKRQASQHAVLHLAMHGLPDYKEALYGALALSENGDTAQDNFLYVYEIYGLDLRSVELVVLGACGTAEGELSWSEGVQSVGKAFLYAGAASLVATQWELNDLAAAKMMEAFYAKLAAGMPKDQALRQAKLEYIKQNPAAAHPFFWANTVFIGDPAPLRQGATKTSGPPWWAWLTGGMVLIALVAVSDKRRRQA